jgi:hypothetical protein
VPLVVVPVQAALTVVAKNNPRRMELLVVNTSVGNIFVGWDAGLTAANGLLISPVGGSLELVPDEDGELVGYQLYAVAPGGPLNLSVWEVETL